MEILYILCATLCTMIGFFGYSVYKQIKQGFHWTDAIKYSLYKFFE